MKFPLNELISVKHAPDIVNIQNELVLMKDPFSRDSENAFIAYKKGIGSYCQVAYLEVTNMTPEQLINSLHRNIETDLADLIRDIRRPYFMNEEAMSYLLTGFQKTSITVS